MIKRRSTKKAIKRIKRRPQRKRKPALNKEGKVYLIGAGPGDPGLLTMKAVELIKTSDLIVHDGLVSREILNQFPKKEKIDVGKHGGVKPASQSRTKCTKQEDINKVLVKLAKEGKVIARLKGGDPFVFGRGGEEASYLKKNKVAFEVIPGISSGLAAPAYAGIPITDRRYASQVVFLTAHESFDKKKTNISWDLLGKMKSTIVCFMAIKNLSRLAQELIKHGKPEKTKISLIERGTSFHQRVISGTLKNISKLAHDQKIQSPALAVVGEVNNLREEISWFDSKPLFGKKVLITRPFRQTSSLKKSLEEQGAQVLSAPMIQILPPKDYKYLDKAIESIHDFNWIVFTSVNSVESFFDRLHSLGKDIRYLSKIKIASIGKMTTQKISEMGIKLDLEPLSTNSEELIENLKGLFYLKGQKFLLPRTQIAPSFLKDELEEAGAFVTEVVAYRTVADPQGKKVLAQYFKDFEIDYIAFTSSSTVQHFMKALTPTQKSKLKAKIVSIGPSTTEAIRKHKRKPHIQSPEANVPSMVSAIVSDSKKPRK